MPRRNIIEAHLRISCIIKFSVDMTINSLFMRQYYLNIVYYIVFTAIFLVYGSPFFMCVWVLNTNVVHNKFISIRSGTFLDKINLDNVLDPFYVRCTICCVLAKISNALKTLKIFYEYISKRRYDFYVN